ncbi:predicted protein [Nematostella vectensis]|uniref:Uncharacterized protein n=1 Tax=Nematostella vectensis TaxID=45351 RepID=A7RMW8_NEMVE|nr:predicted protein [Nematostella vectensis]|eukprot:XP_001639237.1 predicted protein [Nematostella vectensis]
MADDKKDDNPLSFFSTGDDDSSSSDSDSENDKEHDTDNSEVTKKQLHSPESKLPSPDTLFATVGRPSFLATTKEENTIDWDVISKRCEPNMSVYSAPPMSLKERENSAEYNDAMITSQPQKYGKELSDIQKHLLVHGKRPANDIRAMTHREGSGEASFGIMTMIRGRSILYAVSLFTSL